MISNIAEQILDEKTQKLIKIGYLTSDLKLTAKGENVLKTKMFVDNMDYMVERASTKLDDKAAKEAKTEAIETLKKDLEA